MTVQLRDGSTVEDPRLDRLVTPHTEDLDRYPLTAATLPAQRTAMVAGTIWYSNFDRPTRRKVRNVTRWVIGDGDLGFVRGGHATCLRPWGVEDTVGWWRFYDRLKEGRCVEFACCGR